MSDLVVLVLLQLIDGQDALPCDGDALQVSFDPDTEMIRMEGATAIVRITRDHFADLANEGDVEPSAEGVTAFVCALYRDALPGSAVLPPNPS